MDSEDLMTLDQAELPDSSRATEAPAIRGVDSKKLMDDYSKVIKVTVGPEQHVLHVHYDMVVKSSDFFAAALRGPWQEGTNSKVDLPHERPEIFALYIHWMNSGSGYSLLEEIQTPDLIHLNILAHFLQVETLEMRSWCVLRYRYPFEDLAKDTELLRAVLERMPEDSAVRGLVVDSLREQPMDKRTADALVHEVPNLASLLLQSLTGTW